LNRRAFEAKHILKLEGWEGLLAAALLLAVLLAVIFPEAALQGKVFRTPDSLAPGGLQAYVQEHHLDPPLWNPFIFAGMPAFASLSTRPGLYPVSVLLRLIIDGLALPPLTWLLFHYLWAALGLFAFLRRRGVRPWLAWLGGALFILMPAQVAVGAYGHGSKVMTLSWIPWILLFADRLLGVKEAPGWKRLARDSALLAACLSGMLLSAHVQVAYYGLLALGLFGLSRAGILISRGRRTRAVRALGAALLALLLAAGTAAILYGPLREYGRHSIRGAAQGGGAQWKYATAWSLHPAEWSTFLFPSSAGFGEETYFGHMPMTDYPNMLGLFALLSSAMLFIRAPRRRFDLFFLGLALASTLVAAGRYLPFVYRPLYDFLPFFNRFRVPVMILILQQMSVAILFARGFERVLRDARVRADFRWALALGLVLALLVGLGAPNLLGPAAREGLAARLGRQLSGLSPGRSAAILAALSAKSVHWLRAEGLRSALLLLIPLALIELSRRRESFPLAPALMAAALIVLLGELLPLDRRLLHPERHWDSHHGAGLWGRRLAPAEDLPPKPLAFLEKSLDGQRFYALAGSPFAGNAAASRGLASLGGYHAAKLARADSVLGSLGRGGGELLGRFAVKYLVSPRALDLGPDFPAVDGRSGPATWIYGNRRWRPRLFVEDRVSVEDPATSRARLLEGRAESPLYLSADPGLDLSPGEEACGRVLERDFGLDQVSCRVEMKRPGLVVLADMQYPGWQAELDGRSRELLTADGYFRALPVPAGEHRLRFSFRPPGMERLRRWRRASFGLMILLLGLGLLPDFRPGRRAPQ